MSSEAPTGSAPTADETLTPAQRMMMQHTAHQPTVEEEADEYDLTHPPLAGVQPSAPVASPIVPPNNGMSAKAAGKQKAQEQPTPVASAPRGNLPPDTQSEEAFPALGPAKVPQMTGWGKAPASLRATPTNGAARANGAAPPSNISSGRSTPTGVLSPAAGARSPPRAGVGAAPGVSLPGRYVEEMRMPTKQIRTDLKRPVGDLLKDINKRSKAKIEMSRGPNFISFRGTGPTVEAVQQALKDVAAQIGAKQKIKIDVPASVRPHIIGRQGANIQGIQKRSGANIQIPKVEGVVPTADDEDATFPIEIEGNPIAVKIAQTEIETIVKQRTAGISTKLKHIPPEFFPFIAGPRDNRTNALEQGHDVRIRVPQYHRWETSPPRERALDFQPREGHSINISGDREAALRVQAEIERQVQALQASLAQDRVDIERDRHQFVLGDRGGSLHDFLEETGCSIILPPPGSDDERITVVGPPDQLENAVNKVMDLAASMNVTNVDVAKQQPGNRDHAHNHARNVARYLRQRQAVEALERQYNAHFNLPVHADGNGLWQIYSRDPKNGMKARSELMNLMSAHPPARFKNVDIHPFYQRNLVQNHAQLVRDQHGVHLLVPEDEEGRPNHVLLVYEGPSTQGEYEIPRKQPSAAELQNYGRALQEAEQYLLGLIGDQQEIVNRNVNAPARYQEKLRRYIQRQQEQAAAEQHPVEFLGLERSILENQPTVPFEFRGPQTAVDDYEQRLLAFLEEQVRDEKERDYTNSFEFPQKFVNFLVGKGGENINRIRDEYDVEVQFKDGNVEIKGPKAKADSAKAHILSSLRKWEDETTHVVKINPKFHRDIIGPKGSTVSRLQDRYKVRIQFPRTAQSPVDDASSEDGVNGGNARRRAPAQAQDEIVIKGPKKGADECRDEILSLYQYAAEHSHVALVSVSQAQLPSLIGQGGRELEAMRLNTGAEIDIPGSREVADPSGRVEVKVKGKKSAVEAAKKLIEAKVKIFDDSIQRTVQVDKKHHKALIGRDGENIRQITIAAGATGEPRELARFVQFPKPDSAEEVVRVEGPKEVVERIVAAIESFVNLRQNQVTEAIEAPPARHGALIGRGGETRRKLENDFNIKLEIPSTSVTGPARNLIRVTGLPADVEKAKEHIASMVQEQQGETILVPIRLHHAIADTQNANFFRNLNSDLRVTIDHAGRQRPARPQVKPQAAAVSAAKPANLPLITDDPLATSALEDPVTNHTFEMVPSVPAPPTEIDTMDPTIPWILKGPNAEAVMKARAQIEAAMAAAENSVTGFLVLPDPKLHRHVIGPGGRTINEIRKKTGCKIDVPKAGIGPGASGNAIEIKGTREQVEQAKAMVIDAVANSS